jgi:hypothetical protein
MHPVLAPAAHADPGFPLGISEKESVRKRRQARRSSVCGIGLSASTASMMASLLYGVRSHVPAVFLVAPLLLLIVALLASYIPAWRATKVDPIAALREV